MLAKFDYRVYIHLTNKLDKIILGSDVPKFLDLFHLLEDKIKYEIIKYQVAQRRTKIFMIAINSIDNFDLGFENNILLIITCIYNSYDILKYLLENGVDATVNNHLALKCAVHNCEEKIIKLLIDHGCDVNVDNDFPIRYVAYFYTGNFNPYAIKIIKVLVEYGANFHLINEYVLRNTFGKYMDFYDESYCDTLEYLINMGADFQLDNNYVLKQAIRYKKDEFVKILLEHGVDATCLEARDLLNAMYSEKLVTILLSYGAQFEKINDFLKEKEDIHTKNIINILSAEGMDCNKLAGFLCFMAESKYRSW